MQEDIFLLEQSQNPCARWSAKLTLSDVDFVAKLPRPLAALRTRLERFQPLGSSSERIFGRQKFFSERIQIDNRRGNVLVLVCFLRDCMRYVSTIHENDQKEIYLSSLCLPFSPCSPLSSPPWPREQLHSSVPALRQISDHHEVADKSACERDEQKQTLKRRRTNVDRAFRG